MLNHLYSRSTFEDDTIMYGLSVGYEQKVATIVYYSKCGDSSEEDIIED